MGCCPNWLTWCSVLVTPVNSFLIASCLQMWYYSKMTSVVQGAIKSGMGGDEIKVLMIKYAFGIYLVIGLIFGFVFFVQMAQGRKADKEKQDRIDKEVSELKKTKTELKKEQNETKDLLSTLKSLEKGMIGNNNQVHPSAPPSYTLEGVQSQKVAEGDEQRMEIVTRF